MAAGQARAKGETAQAWGDVVLAEPFGRFFELEDVERLDVDAVRLCDGYEYRYPAAAASPTSRSRPVRSSP